MTRVLILGGTGMLGHVLWEQARGRTDAHATVRGDDAPPPLDPERTVTGVRADDPDSVERALRAVRPDVVVNCIGAVKQLRSMPAADMVRVNALFPHELAAVSAAHGARLVHLSTDCVFSGRRGAYTEDDLPDPVDLYGRSKLAGEPAGPHVLTLRTSMIGWELAGRRQGLLEWFAAEPGPVRGYTGAVFSGPTAPELARAILAATERPGLAGTYHLAARPIAKHELLLTLRDALGLATEVVPDAGVRVDRSLVGDRFAAATGWTAPGWDEMVGELVATRPAGEALARR